jgi:hypothetical protein
LVIVAYDITVSFSKERRLIWRTPHSLSKYAFACNRYIVLLTLFVSFVTSSGFHGIDLSDMVRARLEYACRRSYRAQSCRWLSVIITTVLFISLAVGNWLIAARVIVLWDRARVRD